MLHDIIFFLAGLALIVGGGNFVTDGASAIAGRFKISPLVIGLTVVAFGSSTPDLVVCLTSAFEDHPSLAMGDIVGANIFDILLVIGVVAVVTPIKINPSLQRFDIPWLALSCLALFFCADDVLIDRWPHNSIDRSEGFLLLSFFVIYITLTLQSARASSSTESNANVSEPAAAKGLYSRIWVCIAAIIGGLAALVTGGNWLVDGASGIALKAGWSEGLVGLTIVGIGSSVPDLSTSLIAAVKKQPGLALGNVLGACIFNVFFIIGLSASIIPLSADTITSLDFGVLAASGLIIWLLASASKSKTIGRAGGALLIIIYSAYFVKLILDFLK